LTLISKEAAEPSLPYITIDFGECMPLVAKTERLTAANFGQGM